MWLWKENDLKLELCNRIISLIDGKNVAIVDTALAGESLFESHKELYNQLKIHLEI